MLLQSNYPYLISTLYFVHLLKLFFIDISFKNFFKSLISQDFKAQSYKKSYKFA